VLKRGSIRLTTSFQYPNGSYVDLFIKPFTNLFGTSYMLSDFGQSTLYLRELNLSVYDNPKRIEVVDFICAELDVRFKGGNLEMDLSDDDLTDLSPSILRLAQACMRLADLSFSARQRLSNPFRDRVGEFLTNRNVLVTPNKWVPASPDNEVRVDFEIAGKKKCSFVLTMASTSDEGAHASTNEIFRKWYDLGESKTPFSKTHNFVTILNSKSETVMKPGDLRRLQVYSGIYWFPSDQKKIMEAVR
jgi:hypothetical protein